MAGEAELDTAPAPEAPAPEAPAPEAAPVETPPVDEWADPAPLDEGLNQFDRAYVEQLRDREAKYRIKARDYHTEIEGVGAPLSEAKAAVELTKRLQTDDGVIDMFIQAGQALGLGFAELEALFKESDAAAAATGTSEGTPGDDDVVTWAEAKELLRKEVLEPQERAAEVARINTAKSTIDNTFAELGITDETDKRLILDLGQSHIADGDFDPEHIRAAVRKGNELYENRRAVDREKYLEAKLAERQGVPSNTGAAGAPGGQAPPPEPLTMDDAKAKARAQLKALASQ